MTLFHLDMNCINIQMFPATLESAPVVVAEGGRWSWPGVDFFLYVKSRRGSMFAVVYGCEIVEVETDKEKVLILGTIFKKSRGKCHNFYILEHSHSGNQSLCVGFLKYKEYKKWL
ncbi:hypothetical protein Hanom_Chr10g00950111 [Helianthus anomalus]